MLVLGILYMLFARRWLAGTESADAGAASRPSLARLDRGVQARRPRAPGPRHRPLAAGGQDARRDLDLRDTSGVEPASPSSGARVSPRDASARRRKTQLQAGDILLVDLFAARERHRGAAQGLRAGGAAARRGAYFSDRSQEIGMAEVMRAGRTRTWSARPWSKPRSAPHTGSTVIGLRHGGRRVSAAC